MSASFILLRSREHSSLCFSSIIRDSISNRFLFSAAQSISSSRSLVRVSVTMFREAVLLFFLVNWLSNLFDSLDGPFNSSREMLEFSDMNSAESSSGWSSNSVSQSFTSSRMNFSSGSPDSSWNIPETNHNMLKILNLPVSVSMVPLTASESLRAENKIVYWGWVTSGFWTSFPPPVRLRSFFYKSNNKLDLQKKLTNIDARDFAIPRSFLSFSPIFSGSRWAIPRELNWRAQSCSSAVWSKISACFFSAKVLEVSTLFCVLQ